MGKVSLIYAVGLVLALPFAGCDSDVVSYTGPDSGPDAAGRDASSDQGNTVDADSASADSSGGDVPGPDVGGKPDSTPPDSLLPDKPVMDLVQPDKHLPDLATPDSLQPDMALPDLPWPDAAQPDSAQPDLLIPDVMPHDKGIPVVTITNPSPLSPVPVNKAHSIIFKAVGGLGPGSYKWSGQVPAWAKLNQSTGVFAGTPTAPGTYPITVRVDSGPRFDQRSYKLVVVSALVLSGAANPYLKAQCNASSQIKIKGLFSGGLGPYYCTVYSGSGRGTYPGKLNYLKSDPSGCTLSGGFASTDAPGTYGFLVTVSDALGQTLDVPVTCKNGNCPSTTMTMIPAIWPPRVMSPKASYKWIMDLSGVDVRCKNASCSQCGICADILVTISPPITADPNLNCLKAGDVCLYNTKFGIYSKCPTTTTWHGEPLVKAHAPQRGKGLPAWNSLELELSYSGNKLNPCGGKTWTCHWDTLEQ